MLNDIKLLALSILLFIGIAGSQLSAQGPYRCVFDFFSNCFSCTDLIDNPRNYCTSATIYAINCNDLIALISSAVLEEHPGSLIVTDSITSAGLMS